MNLLITGAWQQAEKYIGEIEKMGHVVHFLKYEKDSLPCEYNWVEGIVGNGLFLSHPIEQFVNLRYIQLTSAGFDRVPMKYIEERGMEIYNARGVYSIPMAEYAVAGVLQIYKHMEFFRANQKKHEWNKHRNLYELNGKRICIIGCGNVGTECASRFRAFGCDVIGLDLYPRNDVNYQSMFGLDCMDIELAKADVVILTLPFVDEVKNMMDKEKFGLMKPGAIIVNIARGAIVDTVALMEALDKLGGAVIDVFEEEPLDVNSPLWDFENVILTPHNSFVGEGNQNRLSNVIMNNLLKENGES